jgi:hypothetical protein
MSAVIANCGSMLASATPTCGRGGVQILFGLAHVGRCSTSFDGRLTGRSWAASVVSGRSRPARRTAAGRAARSSASRVWPNCFCSGGSVCAVCASADCWASTSRSLAVPSARWRCTLSVKLVLQLEQALGGRDLAAQRGLLHRGHHHVAAQVR